MKSFQMSVALLISVVMVSSVSAQGDFFFSFTEGGANEDQTSNFDVGDKGSLWVYWSTNGPADSDLNVGAFLDIMSSNSGVIEFTAAETFDYEITVNGTPTGNRILDEAGSGGSVGPADSVDADFIDELSAFTVHSHGGGPGIIEANNGSGVFLDEGYDANNDGFQWGRIDFNVIGIGWTHVTGAAGDGSIVNGNEVVPAEFTTATINICGFACCNDCPEPSAACLLVLGLAGIGIRRKR